MTIADTPQKIAGQKPRANRRSISELLAPLEKIAASSPNLVANHEARFEVDGESYELPRYLFVGPRGGDTPIRVGIFAGIHGDEPEVRLLQAELQSRSFQGIISLHTDDTSEGFYGIVGGATLTKHLIEPALQAAEKILPRDERPIIDGFAARNGIIRDCYDGILSAPSKVRPRPFEIILETPAPPPEYLKEAAFIAALQTILDEYRKFIAYAPNL